jgi:hypothetical protein
MSNPQELAATRREEDELDRAYDELERAAPDRLARMIARVRRPAARLVRIPVGVLCIIGSFFWFLPVLGLWFLPLGLLLIAQDVRFLRRPVGRLTLYLLDRWAHVHQWWIRRRARAKARKRAS